LFGIVFNFLNDVQLTGAVGLCEIEPCPIIIYLKGNAVGRRPATMDLTGVIPMFLAILCNIESTAEAPSLETCT